MVSVSVDADPIATAGFVSVLISGSEISREMSGGSGVGGGWTEHM